MRLALFMLFTACMLDSAYAQVDLRPAASQFIDILAMVATVAGGLLSGFVIAFLKKKTNLADAEMETILAARVNDILHRSIEAARTRMQAEVAKPDSPISSVSFNNWFLDTAVGLAIQSMPDIIKKFKLTDDRIRTMIAARIGAYAEEVPVVGAVMLPPRVVAEAPKVGDGPTTAKLDPKPVPPTSAS